MRILFIILSIAKLNRWDLLKHSEEKQRWHMKLSPTEPCQTGSDTELTTLSDITPRGDIGEEQESDSEQVV